MAAASTRQTRTRVVTAPRAAMPVPLTTASHAALKAITKKCSTVLARAASDKLQQTPLVDPIIDSSISDTPTSLNKFALRIFHCAKENVAPHRAYWGHEHFAVGIGSEALELRVKLWKGRTRKRVPADKEHTLIGAPAQVGGAASAGSAPPAPASIDIPQNALQVAIAYTLLADKRRRKALHDAAIWAFTPRQREICASRLLDLLFLARKATVEIMRRDPWSNQSGWTRLMKFELSHKSASHYLGAAVVSGAGDLNAWTTLFLDPAKRSTPTVARKRTRPSFTEDFAVIGSESDGETRGGVKAGQRAGPFSTIEDTPPDELALGLKGEANCRALEELLRPYLREELEAEYTRVECAIEAELRRASITGIDASAYIRQAIKLEAGFLVPGPYRLERLLGAEKTKEVIVIEDDSPSVRRRAEAPTILHDLAASDDDLPPLKSTRPRCGRSPQGSLEPSPEALRALTASSPSSSLNGGTGRPFGKAALKEMMSTPLSARRSSAAVKNPDSRLSSFQTDGFAAPRPRGELFAAALPLSPVGENGTADPGAEADEEDDDDEDELPDIMPARLIGLDSLEDKTGRMNRRAVPGNEPMEEGNGTHGVQLRPVDRPSALKPTTKRHSLDGVSAGHLPSSSSLDRTSQTRSRRATAGMLPAGMRADFVTTPISGPARDAPASARGRQRGQMPIPIEHVGVGGPGPTTSPYFDRHSRAASTSATPLANPTTSATAATKKRPSPAEEQDHDLVEEDRTVRALKRQACGDVGTSTHGASRAVKSEAVARVRGAVVPAPDTEEDEDEDEARINGSARASSKRETPTASKRPGSSAGPNGRAPPSAADEPANGSVHKEADDDDDDDEKNGHDDGRSRIPSEEGLEFMMAYRRATKRPSGVRYGHSSAGRR